MYLDYKEKFRNILKGRVMWILEPKIGLYKMFREVFGPGRLERSLG